MPLFRLLFWPFIPHCIKAELSFPGSWTSWPYHNMYLLYTLLCLCFSVCLVFGGTSRSESCQLHPNLLLSGWKPPAQVTEYTRHTGPWNKQFVSPKNSFVFILDKQASVFHQAHSGLDLMKKKTFFGHPKTAMWWFLIAYKSVGGSMRQTREQMTRYTRSPSLQTIFSFSFTLCHWFVIHSPQSITHIWPIFAFWTVKKDEFISKSGEWILANVNCAGYYRVNYNSENWQRLLSQLETNSHVSTEPVNEF